MNFFKTSVKPLIKKFHFFDWLVLAGIAVIIVFFFYLRAARKTETISVRILFAQDAWGRQASGTPFWITEGIQPGDKAFNSLGNEVATITQVDVVDTGGPYRNAQVLVDLAVTYDEKTKTYQYNYQPLQIGKQISLAFEKGNVSGLVTRIGQEEMEYTTQKIRLQMKEVLPEIAEQFSVGLQARDISGEVLATIEDVSVVAHQTYEFSDSLNRFVSVVNPEFRDVGLLLTVKSFQNGPTFYYVNNAALKIGNEIWIEFPRVSSGPAIITALE